MIWWRVNVDKVKNGSLRIDAEKRWHEMDHLNEENADLQSEPNRFTSTDGLITRTGRNLFCPIENCVFIDEET